MFDASSPSCRPPRTPGVSIQAFSPTVGANDQPKSSPKKAFPRAASGTPISKCEGSPAIVTILADHERGPPKRPSRFLGRGAFCRAPLFPPPGGSVRLADAQPEIGIPVQYVVIALQRRFGKLTDADT